jgi:hypothetical protein
MSRFRETNVAGPPSKQMPVDRTYSDIATYLGTSKQNAYTAVMIALGKVVFAMRRLRSRELF